MISSKLTIEEAGTASPASPPYLLELPNELVPEENKRMRIRFGQRSQEAVVSARASAATARVSPLLRQALLLPDGLPCQFTTAPEEICIGPAIGLLLGEQKYIYHDKNMSEFTDAMEVYPDIGGLVAAFTAHAIDWESNCVHGLYYRDDEKRWAYGTFPIPSAVFLRAFKLPSSTIERLMQATGGKVFNSVRFSKWEMYQLLRDHIVLGRHLPETVLASGLDVVLQMLDKHERIILKPVGLSRARGIFILRRLDGGHLQVIDYASGSRKREYVLTQPEWEPFFQEKSVFLRSYIAQPHLPLAKIKGSPWDVRVVMQKDETFRWQCTGIECRHAGAAEWITNISRGGRALHLEKALRLSKVAEQEAERIEGEIARIALAYCEEMDRTGHHFAEFGLDIAVDANHHVWLIEANVRPSFNGFKKMDEALYKRICGLPLLYAAALTRTGGEES
ncbi:MAG: YheC/YheD family protein [Tumebacillaceae bacterium]